MFTKEDLDLIWAIHRNVYDRFTYVPDKKVYPDWDDYWTPISGSILARGPIHADCDEFSRICLLKCLASGLNARLVFCLDDDNDGHLICETADKEFQQALFLDNRRVEPVTLAKQIGYTFLSVSPWNPCSGDTRPWVEVDTNALKKFNQGT